MKLATRSMRVGGFVASGAAAIVLLAGCGHAKRPPPPSEREWIDNAAGFIDGLGDTLVLTANGGSDLASARRALHDDSDLYAMLVAYTRFGGCEETLLNMGVPTPRVRRVKNTLTLACRRFQQSAALFTRAVETSDATVLLAATRTALRASPLLYRAKAELDAVRRSAG